MCGLLAGSGNLRQRYITALGCLNSGRGKDSAGIAWVNGSIEVAKVAKNPLAAFTIDLADSINKACETGAVIGHTRAATTGAVIDKNAHPFLVDDIVFAHNGMISNHAKFGEYEVDSECLIHGIKKRDFSEFEGSIALVWLQGNRLFAYRNGNPLYRGLKDGALYLASSDDYLKAIGCAKVRQLAESHIYEIAGGGIIKSNKVPSNKKQSYVGYYSYGWSDASLWHGNARISSQPKPDAKLKCLSCGHEGRSHSSIVATTGKWGCFAHDEGSHICSCNEFVEKKEENSIAIVEKCSCGHVKNIHTYGKDNNKCSMFNCPCQFFSAAKETKKANDTAWGDIPINTLCDCAHELEYHTTGGNRHGCGVQSCTCDFFWPVDTTEPEGNDPEEGNKPLKPGWDESWRTNNKVSV